MSGLIKQVQSRHFLLKFLYQVRKVMYLCGRGIDLASF